MSPDDEHLVLNRLRDVVHHLDNPYGELTEQDIRNAIGAALEGIRTIRGTDG